MTDPRPEERPGPPLLETSDLVIASDAGPRLTCSEPTVVRGRSLVCVGAARALLEAIIDPGLVRQGSLLVMGSEPLLLLASGNAGYCPAELPAPPDFTVEAALLGSARLIGLGKSDVSQALARTEAESLGRRRLGDLGPLERRLVGLAHGLTGNPELVLLEDPWNHLGDDAAELVFTTIERELANRSWIAEADLQSPWARRLAQRAEQALVLSGTTLLGPVPPADLASSGSWARFDQVTDSLLQGLADRGAEVVRTPSDDVVLVRRLGGLALAECALSVGSCLLELVPLPPS